MATMQGLTGKLSGKMGSAVFRVREGQQVVAQYNPIVKNPNTQKQQDTRAAFKLMSQLGAIMSPGFGTMSVTKRPAKGKPSQRNSFFELNYKLIEVSTSNGETTAKIPMEQLQLTSSFRSLPPITATPDVDEITISSSGVSAEVASVRLVLLDYRGNGITQAAINQIVDVPVTNETLDYTFSGLSAGNYTILAYGLIPSETTAKSIDLDNIHTPADENFISAVQLNEMVAAGDMAETMTVGVNVALAE